jgi:hypothetical protein
MMQTAHDLAWRGKAREPIDSESIAHRLHHFSGPLFMGGPFFHDFTQLIRARDMCSIVQVFFNMI